MEVKHDINQVYMKPYVINYKNEPFQTTSQDKINSFLHCTSYYIYRPI